MTNAKFRKGFSMETAEARRLGRLRMNGCETHAPVRITLRDRKRSYPALRGGVPASDKRVEASLS